MHRVLGCDDHAGLLWIEALGFQIGLTLIKLFKEARLSLLGYLSRSKILPVFVGDSLQLLSAEAMRGCWEGALESNLAIHSSLGPVYSEE
jgi:hypothetical protein